MLYLSNYLNPYTVDVNSLPDDPISSSFPEWQSSQPIEGLILILTDILSDMNELYKINEDVVLKLQDYLRKSSYHLDIIKLYNDIVPEIGSICKDHWEFENRIIIKKDIAILLSAITVEDLVNKFCVFNLLKNEAEKLERKPVIKKLKEALKYINSKETIDNAIEKKINSLFEDYRNQLGHGHLLIGKKQGLRDRHFASMKIEKTDEAIGKIKLILGVLLDTAAYLEKKRKNKRFLLSWKFVDIKLIKDNFDKYKFENTTDQLFFIRKL